MAGEWDLPLSTFARDTVKCEDFEGTRTPMNMLRSMSCSGW